MKKNRIKILVLSHISELVGGAELSIMEVCDILSKRYNVEPEFILREPLGTYVKALKKHKWKYHSLPYTFWSEENPPKEPRDLYKHQLVNSKAVLRIEEIIKTTKPDFVLTNSVVCPWAALAAYYQRIPHVWFVREYGDLDHGRVFEIGRKSTWQDVGNLSELVIANSRSLADHVKQHVDPLKVTTLYHPFDIKTLKKRTKQHVESPYKLTKSLKLIITAGSITASKGQLEAVQATGELNKAGHEVELCVIGNNGAKDFMSTIHAAIKKYEIEDKVHFMGYVKNEKVLAYVSHADVGIMASRKEAFGRVTFEYLVAGKPVLGTNSGATPEMIRNGQNGYLYKYKDTTSLIKGIQHYINDMSLINTHGQKGEKIAEKMMSGTHDVNRLYGRLKKVARRDVTLPHPINYMHRWLEYPVITNKYINQVESQTLRRLIKRSVKIRLIDLYKLIRVKVGSLYRKLRSVIR